MDIFSTVGGNELMRDEYYASGEGFVIVYSINDRDSFDFVNQIYQDIKLIKKNETVPIFIIGTNCYQSGEREVEYSEGESLGELLRVQFFEISSYEDSISSCCFKLKEEVEKAFFQIFEELRKYTSKTSQSELELEHKIKGGCYLN